ncbi:MAG: hypothetical protein AAFO07_08435 [Bacteroidota bacterium]
MKAISYFDDIDPGLDPPMMEVKLSLEEIKTRITKAIENPDQKFDDQIR